MSEQLTEREEKLWEVMSISRMQNGQIIVPPGLKDECEAVLEKLESRAEGQKHKGEPL